MIMVEEALEVLKKITDLEMMELIGICLKSSYFRFKGKIYEQTHGIAMGSPLSPLIANLLLEIILRGGGEVEHEHRAPGKKVRYAEIEVSDEGEIERQDKGSE